MIYIVNIAWVLVLVSMCVAFDRLFREVGHRLKKALEREQAAERAKSEQAREFRRLLTFEYRYWKNASEKPEADHDTQMTAMGAMGAVSNVMVATLGKPAPWHQKKAEDSQ